MGKYSFKINGHDYDVEVKNVEGGIAKVTVNGNDYNVELGETATGRAQASFPGVFGASTSSAANLAQTSTTNAPKPAAVQSPATQSTAAQAVPASGKGETVTSPLPGVLLDVKVKVGDSVKVGQTVAVIEAMKMENEIEATVSGTVIAVNAAKGDSVLEGAAIITIG